MPAEVAEEVAAKVTLGALAVVGQHAESAMNRGLPKFLTDHLTFPHMDFTGADGANDATSALDTPTAIP